MSSAKPAPTETRRVSPWWRILSFVLLIALLLAWATGSSMFEQLKAQIGHLQTRIDQTAQVRYVAVLQDREGLPAMLITLDPKDGAMTLQRLNDVKEGREDSLQIWALSADAAPRSLGVIESKYKTLQMPVSEADLQGATEIAISAEDKGGVAVGSAPSLPWLFKGWLVQKSL
jgi:anti-sigma-K factor RskA